MGRGRVELKRIEDKSSRQASFSKRRNGLMKKTHELAVLCDVDVALFIFSGRGRLYEFSSGESMIKILTRYQSFKKTEELTRISVQKQKFDSEHVCTADELTQMIKWHLEQNNIQLLDITGLNQLEQQLDSLLQQVRIRKTQKMMGVLKALQEEAHVWPSDVELRDHILAPSKEMQLKKEKEFMMKEIMAATSDGGINNDSGDPSQAPQLPVPVMDAQIFW